MKNDTLNRRVLNQLAAKIKRAKGFKSPGTVGRKQPTLSLAGPLASSVGSARVGDKVSLRVSGQIRATPQLGQKPEVVLGVEKVRRTR